MPPSRPDQTTPLWTPSDARVAATNLKQLMARAEDRYDLSLPDYDAVWQWSIDHSEDFWRLFWDDAGVIAETQGARVLVDGDKMPGARFFPDARLNYAENLLRRRDATPALIFQGESQVRRTYSWRDLYDETARMAQALRAEGLKPGDRVAAFMPNMPETVIVMLAAVSLGATFTSASPDFGARGVLDRFGQVTPTILVAADGYFYNGKAHDSLGKIPDILAGMPSVKKCLIVPYTRENPVLDGLRDTVLWGDYIADYAPNDITFAQLPFHHPLYILYSSGTTGVPKCIVHSAGGALLMHLKEHKIACDLKPGDVLFWFTTCGWMMWNWLASALASEATLVLYDGSPFFPDGNVLFDLADDVGVTFFGTSAKYIDACNKAGLKPRETHSLKTVQSIGSTGSPLVPEGFDYVYQHIKADVHLGSMSGGTDLLGCFAGANPIGPVWRGEIQKRSIAMAVDVFDDDGQPLTQEKGELVCTKPFPSMPLGFWNDPEDARYKAAYFEKFPNVWTHGDWVDLTDHGGMIIYGRSDATLNPGGVRIGTAEIYRQVEAIDQVVEALVIGQEWDGDTRVVLFVRLRDGLDLDDDLIGRIRKQIRDNATPRHVPAKVVQVADIPRTKSGKIVELAVREVVHGRPVKNKDALANPEALAFFENRSELSR